VPWKVSAVAPFLGFRGEDQGAKLFQHPCLFCFSPGSVTMATGTLVDPRYFDGDVCRGTTDQKASGIHAISCPKRNENSFPSRHACMHALIGLLRALAPAGPRKKGQWLFRGNGTRSAAVLRTDFTTIKG